MATLRTSETTHKNLKELSILTGLSMQAVLDQAISSYQRALFLEKLNEDFATLRAYPRDWDEAQEEYKFWEQSLADGLLSTENEDA